MVVMGFYGRPWRLSYNISTTSAVAAQVRAFLVNDKLQEHWQHKPRQHYS
jgi:hypothetical protein